MQPLKPLHPEWDGLAGKNKHLSCMKENKRNISTGFMKTKKIADGNNFPSAYFFAFSGCLEHPAGGETPPNPWMIMKELFDKYFDHEPEI